MDSLDRIFESFPELAKGLTTGSWRSHFDSRTLARCAEYANGASIRTLRLKEDGKGFGFITAGVQGTARAPYRVEIYFESENGVMELTPEDCSCPVGYGCKHAAAVLLYLEKRGKLFSAVQGIVSTGPQLDWQAEDWLKRMKGAAASNVEPEKKASTYNKFLAYCLLVNPRRAEPVLSLRLGSRLKSGAVSMDTSYPTADTSNPPKYMADEDILLVLRLRTLQRKQYGYDGLSLDTPGSMELLKDLLATGRLFVGDATSRKGLLQVSMGPAEQVEAVWNILPGGAMKPALEFSREDLAFAATEPPFYVDAGRALIGPLESEIPGNLLRLWTEGPAVKQSLTTQMGEKLRTLPGKPIPVPVEMEEEKRPAEALVGTLRIERGDIGGESAVLGFPAFSYGDSPPLFAADEGPQVDSHSEILGNRRVTWPRDPAAERNLLGALWDNGFEPLAAYVRPEFLGKRKRYAVIREGRDFTNVSGWLDFLNSSQSAALEKAGWRIEADPKAGLTVHDVADFFPEIEDDPDHGIDWFRFDISGEMDGKRFSLIPHIATAIEGGILGASPELGEIDAEETILIACENPDDGYIRFPAVRFREICQQVAHLFRGGGEPGRIDRLGAADLADSLGIDSSETTRALAKLGKGLKNITSLPAAKIPKGVKADLRAYQAEGFSWLQFLAEHGLHGILADDMGLGKTLQTLTHLAAERARKPGLPSLVIAPTSVVPNWAAEAEKFTPGLKVITLQGTGRADDFKKIPKADLVLTSYPLLTRDMEILEKQDWHCLILDEAQYIKNPKAIVAKNACKLKAAHRICLSGTPMENHLGELWSLMRFLMPGFLGDEKTFNSLLRKPIERDRSTDAQRALNRRVSPLILRRTKDQVATELPEKTVIIHHIELTRKQTDLYESVRAAMDQRVRDAIAAKGLAQSHIIVLDALLKLRQICCHPQLLKIPAAAKITESAKLDFLTGELLPTLLEEGRRILLFSQFTSMLALIEAHLEKENIPFLKLTGQTKDRASLVKKFQAGEVPIFLISLKAGGTGLNLTAADTVIHYDPWWNPAAENQATDRAHRIGQNKPVFVHKLACRGTIEDRILDLQKHKSALVEALLSEETTKLKIDSETLSHLLSPLE